MADMVRIVCVKCGSGYWTDDPDAADRQLCVRCALACPPAGTPQGDASAGPADCDPGLAHLSSAVSSWTGGRRPSGDGAGGQARSSNHGPLIATAVVLGAALLVGVVIAVYHLSAPKATGTTPAASANAKGTGAGNLALSSGGGGDAVRGGGNGSSSGERIPGAPGFFAHVPVSTGGPTTYDPTASSQSPASGEATASASGPRSSIFQPPGAGERPAGPAAPAVAAPPDPRYAELAEDFLKTAKRSAIAAEAVAALRKSVEYNPQHVEANVLLAKLLVDAKDLKGAIEQVARARRLLDGQPDASGELKSALASAEKRLAGLRGPLTRWVTDRPAFAARYLGVADTQADCPLPSTVVALHRSAVLRPDDAELAAVRDKAEAASAKLPQPATQPDSEAAKLLHDKAAQRIAAGRFQDARDLMTSAVSLDPDQCDYWFDLGVCCAATQAPSLAAMCLLEAREQLEDLADMGAATVLAGRIRSQLERLDGRIKLLDEIDAAVIKEAQFLIERSTEVGDDAAVATITEDIRALGLSLPTPVVVADPTPTAPPAGTPSAQAPTRRPDPAPAAPVVRSRPPEVRIVRPGRVTGRPGRGRR